MFRFFAILFEEYQLCLQTPIMDMNHKNDLHRKGLNLLSIPSQVTN